MKNLNTYVEELLYRHQCVIIPDFGAFVSNRRAAELTQDNTFSPPQKELTFNSRLTYNDGLLAKHISEVEKISYEEAQEYIKTTANQWKEVLQNKQQLVFDNLGTFVQGTNGNIVFEPSNKENYLTDSFGMSSFTAHQVNKEEEATATVQEASMENPIVSPEEAQAGKPKRKLPVLVKYAAVGVVALSAISYGVYMFLNQPSTETTTVVQADPQVVQQKLEEKIRNEQAAFLQNPIEVSEAVAVEVKKDAKLAKRLAEEAKQKAKAEAAAEAQAQKQAEAEARAKEKAQAAANQKSADSQNQSASTSQTSLGNFHLIAGAFSSEQNAQNRIKQLKQNGYTDASIVGKNAKGLILVSYKSFNTKAEAEAEVVQFKSKGLDTWVYSK